MSSSALRDAQDAIRERLPERCDDFRPAYHLSPPIGWMNDPNGLIFFHGEYHVFYQFHPYSPQWGPMHWGHAKSADLVHWEHLPVALAPDSDPDGDGCFSGSAVVWEDTLYLIYTGHRWLGEPGREDQGIEQVQCLASSRDGIDFTKHGAVIQPPQSEIQHFRDPKVWRHDGEWRMALGARVGDNPQLLLYRSTDLLHWDLLNCALAGERSLDGFMWECPDLFSFDDQDVLLYSPQGLQPQGYLYRNLYQNGYRLGRLDSMGHFTPHTNFVELDHGHDCYAAQTMLAPDGRRLLWAWMDMWESPMPSQAHGWCGSLTLPREVTLIGNHLYQKPARELATLRKHEYYLEIGEVHAERRLLPVAGELLELDIILELAVSDAERYGLALRCSADSCEETLLYVDAQAGRLVLDRERSGKGVAGVRSLPLPSGQTQLTLKIYLDRSSIEVFVDNGLHVMTSRLYPQPDSQGIYVFSSNGRAVFSAARAWALRDLKL
ncbi:sucrose-6-phosphate hydrolase [Pseudomonas sp. LTJR-52]|uniref:glycoside hydrolase family 32 protein n=1 Tax=Pseudomonas sp. LTJR-52 TaxID=2479392 RepID=UPI000EFB28FC|nr:sucrose-6-phosphate hydrolase [Pseudomonas sp. LTJR-52]AYN94676.1 sucrose-6-phosphate hydrolase [Pseudomonas sp. LTJR-52]